VLELVILGLVQGLTEFLPVSSTAHLLFTEHYLGIPRPGLVLEAALHLGTALAAIVMFWPDVRRLLQAVRSSFWRDGGESRERHPDRSLLVAILAATAVTAVLGVLFEAPLTRMFESVRGTALQLLITGIVLLWHQERGGRTGGEATVRDGVALGLAQALAIVPGISRSGITIVAALGLGFRRVEAARLSFLMAIPAIVGASLFSLRDSGQAVRMGFGPLSLLVGAAVAAVSGAMAIAWLLHIVTRGRLVWFAAYCWVAGLLVLATAG
jgi:undecaprenyl-diphosphatase